MSSADLWRRHACTVPFIFIYIKVLYSGPERDVLSNSHMSEQGIALEHHADAPLLHRYVSGIHLCSKGTQVSLNLSC